MSIEELGVDRAIVVRGEDVAAVGWALERPLGPEGVVILGPDTAHAVMLALDGLRSSVRQAEEAATQIDVERAKAVADGIFSALAREFKNRFAKMWHDDNPPPDWRPAETAYYTTSFKTEDEEDKDQQ